MNRTLVGLLLITTIGLVAAKPEAAGVRAGIAELFGLVAELRTDVDANTEELAALGGREVVFAFTPADLTSFKSVIVECPEGKVSIGGGGRITFVPGSGSVGQAIANSYPDTETSWSVSAVSPNPAAAGWQLIGYAVCAAL
jgi:hypothetical protein